MVVRRNGRGSGEAGRGGEHLRRRRAVRRTVDRRGRERARGVRERVRVGREEGEARPFIERERERRGRRLSSNAVNGVDGLQGSHRCVGYHRQ
jgi:hypothetical protein